MAGSVIDIVRRNTKKTVIAKLTPAVTDIIVMAKAARDNGADALTLSNGYPGLAISANQKTGSRKYSGRHLRTFLKASEHASCLESISGC